MDTPEVVERLRELGLSVERHRDHFPQGAKDEEWLAHVGQAGWYAVTRDTKIRYRIAERSTLTTHGVGLFVLTGKGLNADAMANALSTALRAITRLIRRQDTPFVARVTATGDVALVWPPTARTK